ncbi:MAG: hypothetical protein LQ337_000423 [Flavoplaca oasis]|nr:MAG: hypothetical protein LQ337_000423 [Flavoplaca oasis]
MATASNIQLSLAHCGEYHVPHIAIESAVMGSEVLQENHEMHHIFFNQSGFHNHIAHHIPTVFALGASPAAIRQHYQNNKSYQLPSKTSHRDVVRDLHDPAVFLKHLGQEAYYSDYLAFYQDQIDRHGCEEAVNYWLLRDDECANAILVRMYAGFLHPIIHLGFGIEFNQPAIIAEALAQAAVHEGWIGPFLLETEKAAAGTQVSRSLVEILDQIRTDPKLRMAAHWDDDNKVRDGILARAPNDMVKYAAQWKVGLDDLEVKTAEMTNAAVYFTGGAQHPPKQIKFDFYYMHCVNSSIFFSSFLKQSWITAENKVRLLQFKGWLDLAMYASRRAPEPLLDEIVHYRPKHPEGCWDEIFKRVVEHEDDGHASKLIRALKHGQQICKSHNEKPMFRVKDNMWLSLAHMGESEYHSNPSAYCNCADEFPKRSTRLKIRVIRG